MNNYEPNQLVRAGHHIPHLNNHLQSTTNNFDTISTDSTGYVISIIVFPAIIVAIGILSIVIYQLVLCCKFCCKCCKAGFQRHHGESFIVSINKNNPTLMFFFYTFVVFAIIANFCVFKSNTYFSNSIDQSSSAMSDLAATFQTIKNIGNSLVDTGNDMETIMSSVDCAAINLYMGDVTTEIEDFVNSAEGISSTVGGFPSTIDDARSTFVHYANQKNLVVYLYFAVICGIILFLILTSCCKSKIYLNFSIFLTEIVVLTLTVIAGAELIAVALLADFCYSPSENILSVYDSGPGYDILSYYTSCVGLSPFNYTFGNITAYISEINQTINAYKSITPPECYLGSEISNISDTVGNLATTISCPPIYDIYDQAVNNSLCDSFYNGIFVMCITHFLTAGSLYFILMVVSHFHSVYEMDAAIQEGDQDNLEMGTFAQAEYAHEEQPYEAEIVKVDGVEGKQHGKGPYWEVPNYK